MQWLLDGHAVPLEDMVALTVNLISSGLHGLPAFRNALPNRNSAVNAKTVEFSLRIHSLCDTINVLQRLLFPARGKGALPGREQIVRNRAGFQRAAAETTASARNSGKTRRSEYI